MSVTEIPAVAREPHLDQAGRQQRISELVLEHGSVTIGTLTARSA
jgi:hypothetical protein